MNDFTDDEISEMKSEIKRAEDEKAEVCALEAAIKAGSRISELPAFPVLEDDFCGRGRDTYCGPARELAKVQAWLAGCTGEELLFDLTPWIPFAHSPEGRMDFLRPYLPCMNAIDVVRAAMEICDRYYANRPGNDATDIVGMQVWLRETNLRLAPVQEHLQA